MKGFQRPLQHTVQRVRRLVGDVVLLAVAALAITLPVSAAAETGVGSGPNDDWSVAQQTRAPPLAALAEDSVRFSMTPSLGGRAYIMVISRKANFAEGSIRFYVGHPTSRRWRDLGQVKFRISLEAYKRLVDEVDAAWAAGEPDQMLPDAQGEVMICVDGPELKAERRRNGESIWMTGKGCAQRHPNDIIVGLITRVAEDELCRYGIMSARRETQTDE